MDLGGVLSYEQVRDFPLSPDYLKPGMLVLVKAVDVGGAGSFYVLGRVMVFTRQNGGGHAIGYVANYDVYDRLPSAHGFRLAVITRVWDSKKGKYTWRFVLRPPTDEADVRKAYELYQKSLVESHEAEVREDLAKQLERRKGLLRDALELPDGAIERIGSTRAQIEEALVGTEDHLANVEKLLDYERVQQAIDDHYQGLGLERDHNSIPWRWLKIKLS